MPDSLHDKVRELARRDGVSVNQFIATAVADKASALLTVDYLEQRARRADPDLFAQLLSRVPDVEPMPDDELPTEGAVSAVRGPGATLKRERPSRVRPRAGPAACRW